MALVQPLDGGIKLCTIFMVERPPGEALLCPDLSFCPDFTVRVLNSYIVFCICSRILNFDTIEDRLGSNPVPKWAKTPALRYEKSGVDLSIKTPRVFRHKVLSLGAGSWELGAGRDRAGAGRWSTE